MSDPLDPVDDLDIEVSALHTTPPPPSSRPQERVSSTAAPPRTPRRRWLIVTSLLVLLAALLSALLFAPPDNRATIVGLLTRPTAGPTPVLEVGDDAFLWEHTVPWGSLLIDGRPGPDVGGAALQMDIRGTLVGAPFHLSRGRHTLQYRAAPFPTLTCTLSVPATFNDTCPLDANTDRDLVLPAAPTTRLLDLQADIEHLPRGQSGTLLNAAQAYLMGLGAQPAGSIAVDDHYRDAAGEVIQATTPLGIAPQYVLTNPYNDDPPCLKLCSGTIFDAYPSAGWVIYALVAVTWRYTTPDGQTTLQFGPAGAREASSDMVISLVARWTGGGWLLTQWSDGRPPSMAGGAPEPIICSVGEQYRATPQATPWQSAAPQFQWSVAMPTADLGCLYVGSQVDPTTGKLSGPVALALYRAGALMAVNGQAKQAFPTLPLASAHEAALAQAVAPGSLA
jgi:hypothetical protein